MHRPVDAESPRHVLQSKARRYVLVCDDNLVIVPMEELTFGNAVINQRGQSAEGDDDHDMPTYNQNYTLRLAKREHILDIVLRK